MCGSTGHRYQYDALGNLMQVTWPGAQIDYGVDGLNRRVLRAKNGATTHKWVYAGGVNPVAELDASDAVTKRFVYATRGNVPDYMLMAGERYRLVTDQIGSVRQVIRASNGAVMQQMSYDEFGRVLEDTNPGFQPFGFAGGLYDRESGLVRFGARDYDPEVGRWTTKDPILFAGGDPNLYGYVLNDPVNAADPEGTWSVCFNIGAPFVNLSIPIYDSNKDLSLNPEVSSTTSMGGIGFSVNLSDSDVDSDLNIDVGLGEYLGYGYSKDLNNTTINVGVGVGLPVTFSTPIANVVNWINRVSGR